MFFFLLKGTCLTVYMRFSFCFQIVIFEICYNLVTEMQVVLNYQLEKKTTSMPRPFLCQSNLLCHKIWQLKFQNKVTVVL
jgi:hypothetical protein